MLFQSLGCFALAALTLSGEAASQEPLGSIATLRSAGLVERPTEIAVVATPHLRMFEDSFDAGALESIIERLAAWGPDVVCVESLAADSVRLMLEQEVRFAPVLEQFAAAHRTGARYVAGEAAGEAMQALQGYEPVQAALLHARGETAGIPTEAQAWLEELASRPDEIWSIALPVALRAEVDRIVGIDDHKEKDLFFEIAPELGRMLADNPAAVEVIEDPFYAEWRTRFEVGFAEGDVLEPYIWMNSRAYTRRDVELQWGLFMRTNLESGVDRTRLALWEVRNLDMASHIRRASSSFPGGRVLVLVGAAHKPFLDEYLETMLDVTIIDTAALLAGE